MCNRMGEPKTINSIFSKIALNGIIAGDGLFWTSTQGRTNCNISLSLALIVFFVAGFTEIILSHSAVVLEKPLFC